MNSVNLIGRLTRDPELKTTQSGISVVSFTVAVDRKFKNKQTGEQETDFINCVAWRQTAEFVAKYFGKGVRIGVSGSMQVRSYDDKNGERKHVTEVVADSVSFADGKTLSGQTQAPSRPQTTQPDLGWGSPAPANNGLDLPFDL